MASSKRKLDTNSDTRVAHKELDKVSCPICMDHPHNAVLLRCTSHEKGCTSFICDTSYRHSNCLDRFKKQREFSGSSQENMNSSETNVNSSDSGSSLRCPLCRGAVLGWDVVEEARKYLNSKIRSCSRESCSFTGTYQELRRHARRVHPTTRPCDVDPSRERAWRCLERQRDYGDIISAVRSAMPGAVVVGDYVIENGDRFGAERDGRASEVNSPWLTTFLLFEMIGSSDRPAEPRARSRAWTRNRRAGGALPERRFLWGENLLGLQYDDNDDDNGTGDDGSPVPRRRRRLNRSRSGDQP